MANLLKMIFWGQSGLRDAGNSFGRDTRFRHKNPGNQLRSLRTEINMTSLHHLRIITQKELRLLVPYTPQHILRLEKAGKFPRRIRLGQNRVGWRLVDIEAWIASRIPAPLEAADPYQAHA